MNEYTYEDEYDQFDTTCRERDLGMNDEEDIYENN